MQVIAFLIIYFSDDLRNTYMLQVFPWDLFSYIRVHPIVKQWGYFPSWSSVQLFCPERSIGKNILSTPKPITKDEISKCYFWSKVSLSVSPLPANWKVIVSPSLKLRSTGLFGSTWIEVFWSPLMPGKNVNGPDKNSSVLPNAYGCHLNSRIIRSFISV